LQISIPFGAIKSHNLTLKHVNFIPISIPFGAIKRTAQDKIGDAFKKFQFLLVRLKDAGK